MKRTLALIRYVEPAELLTALTTCEGRARFHKSEADALRARIQTMRKIVSAVPFNTRPAAQGLYVKADDDSVPF